MSLAPSLLKFPVQEPTTLDQAADMVDDFALETGLDALTKLTEIKPLEIGSEQGLDRLQAVREQARALTEQCQAVEEELARFLARVPGA